MLKTDVSRQDATIAERRLGSTISVPSSLSVFSIAFSAVLELAVDDLSSQIEELARQRYNMFDREILECIEQGTLESHAGWATREQAQREPEPFRIGDERREVDRCWIDLITDGGGEMTARRQRIRRARQSAPDSCCVDVKRLGETVSQRARQLRLARHHAPELLARRPGVSGEVLLREAALNPQHLDLLPDRCQLDE
jgi:hypothetical protein